MPSTYSSLKIQLMATGENNTTWGDVTNVNLGTAIEEAIVGSADVAFSNANVTLTLTDTNATQTARNMRLNLTGTATAGYNLIVPAIEKPYIVNNGTDGTITVKNSTGTGIAVPAGKTMWVFNNGTNVVDVTTYLSSLTLGSALGVASGGTGTNTLTSGYLLKGNGTSAVSASVVYDTGTNVGIGTSSPKTRIQASAGTNLNAPSLGSATNAPFYITNTDPAYGLLAGTSASDGHVWLQAQRTDGTATAYNITLNEAGGNVGIGTASPSQKLHIYGANPTLYIQGDASSYYPGAQIVGNWGGVGIGTYYGGNISGLNRLVFLTGSSVQDGGTERMRIESSGNVGIGTSSPSSKLTVGGNPPQSGAIAGVGSSGGISLALSDNVNNSLFIKHIAGAAATLGTDPGGQLALATDGFNVRLNIDATGAITSSNLADAVGYKGLPQNSQTSSYTLALTDMGKHISITTGGVVIPANGSVAFPVGTTIVVFNNSGSTQTISITTDTLRQAGTTNTGSRTLAVYGLATLVKVASTTWVVTGNVT